MIPTQNINFKIHDSDSQELLGVAEATLPEFEAMSETISGAGLAGEVDMPVLGHFGSMTAELKWRAMTRAASKLNRAVAHYLDMRGSIEQYEEHLGIIASVPMKVAVITLPKSLNLGNLNVGKAADTSSKLECVYIKVWLGGKEVVELDKFNYVYRVHGVDYLASVRRDLGMSG